jgi:hypothetical protein
MIWIISMRIRIWIQQNDPYRSESGTLALTKEIYDLVGTVPYLNVWNRYLIRRWRFRGGSAPLGPSDDGETANISRSEATLYKKYTYIFIH